MQTRAPVVFIVLAVVAVFLPVAFVLRVPDVAVPLRPGATLMMSLALEYLPDADLLSAIPSPPVRPVASVAL